MKEPTSNASEQATRVKYASAKFDKATELLAQVLTAPGAADGVIDRYFKAHRNMGSTDRRFAAATVYGCLRHRRELLAIAKEVIKEPWPIDDTAMLVGVFLLRYERWPAEAFKPTVFADIVNIRPYPESDGDEKSVSFADHLRQFDSRRLPPAEQLSLPDWLYHALNSQMSEAEISDLVESLNQPATVDLRVNLRQGSVEQLRQALLAEDIETAPTTLSSYGLRRAIRGPLQNTRAFKQGCFEFQDEGSQLISWLLMPEPGEFIVDYCAGAGGKTLHLADIMNNRGTLLACDIAARRLAQLKPRLARAGIRNVVSQVLLPGGKELEVYQRTADGVLVDAPCSGTGTLRRSPDLRWRDIDLAAMQQQQLDILVAASELVRSGGRLVYATCSLLAEENQAVVALFLALDPRFEIDPLPRVSDDPTHAALADVDPALLESLLQSGMLQLWPHRHGTDGFFAQRLRRI
jgi:16S rRNA (cytosine967-C5)-methyltransferase